MQLACTQCGTRDIRVSHHHGFLEQLRGLIGKYQLRCRRCSARWETSVWEDGAWKYARCPRCYRQELTTWSEQYYHRPAGRAFACAWAPRRTGARPAAATSP